MRPEPVPHSAQPAGVSTSEVAGEDRQEALQADLAHLRGLLERGDVEGARAWVKELANEWPDSGDVRHYTRVLAPPLVSVRRGHRGPSRQRERAWLRAHAREYPGQWLAVLADRLVAADPDLSLVLAVVRKLPDTQRPLLHFQPESAD